MNKEGLEENFLVRNLESGFLEIHFSTKEAYLDLSSKNRELIKNKFRWSRPGNCWVSKADFDLCKVIADRFCKLGLQDRGWKGSRIPFEKKIIQRLNKYAAIAAKYEAKGIVCQRSSAKHRRNVEHNQQLLSVEPDRFKKQDLKRKIEISASKAVSALENANFCSEQVKNLLERSVVLELNLSNPKYLKNQLYKQRIGPLMKRQKNIGNLRINTRPPLTDKLQAERLLFIGRFKTEQEETQFYKNRLRTIVGSISDDLSLFYGKPVFMSKRWADEGIGRVVGHQPEDGKLVLKLNDGSYMAKELDKLTVLAPTYEILNVLVSKNADISEKSKLEGFKALTLIHKDKPLEAMQVIQRAGLSKHCLIKCDQLLINQLKMKKSLERSRKIKL